MQKIKGTYHNGHLKLDQPLEISKPVRVTIIIENEKKKGLKLSDFSFLKSQESLKDYDGSFSQEVIEERRRAL